MTPLDDASSGIASVDAEVADADLVLRARSGDSAAFGELWRRHYRSGIAVARSVTSSLDADDLVQEAYSRIYQSILKGGGPTGSFRAYLFTSIRNTAAAWGRARKETAIDELDAVEDPASSAQATDDALDRSITVQAFRSLPTRWQEVLWYSEIEAMKPAEIAPLLGMKPTAVAQLAFRAREGLRESWIQAHVRSVEDGSDCQWTIERLGAYARGNLGTRDTGRLEKHLADCARCTIVAAEAKDVSNRLALVLLPLTVGVTGAAGYLASLQTGGAAVVALAAMPSAVVQGAVTVGAVGSAASSSAASAGSAGSAASTAASSVGAAAGSTTGAGAVGAGAAASVSGGIFSSISVLVGIAAVGVVVAGAVVAMALAPSLVRTAPQEIAQPGIEVPLAPAPSSDTPAPAVSASTPTEDPVVEPSTEAGTTPKDEETARPDAKPADPPPAPAPVAPDPGTPEPAPEPENPGPVKPDPGPEPPASALPSGSPTLASSTSFFTGTRLNIALTVRGEPGASVQAIIRGAIRATATVGADGTAVLTVRPTLVQVVANAFVGIRYVAGTEAGPQERHRIGELVSAP